MDSWLRLTIMVVLATALTSCSMVSDTSPEPSLTDRQRDVVVDTADALDSWVHTMLLLNDTAREMTRSYAVALFADEIYIAGVRDVVDCQLLARQRTPQLSACLTLAEYGFSNSGRVALKAAALENAEERRLELSSVGAIADQQLSRYYRMYDRLAREVGPFTSEEVALIETVHSTIDALHQPAPQSRDLDDHEWLDHQESNLLIARATATSLWELLAEQG